LDDFCQAYEYEDLLCHLIHKSIWKAIWKQSLIILSFTWTLFVQARTSKFRIGKLINAAYWKEQTCRIFSDFYFLYLNNISDVSSIIFRCRSIIISHSSTYNLTLNLFSSIFRYRYLKYSSQYFRLNYFNSYHSKTTFMWHTIHYRSTWFRRTINSQIISQMWCTPFNRNGLWWFF
jgi:hypothetical protein